MNATINAAEIRTAVRPFIKKQRFTPYLIFFIDWVLFATIYMLIIIAESLWIMIPLSTVQGLIIGLLFVVGHDCCHNSFTKRRRANQVLGKIAFLPSLHNFSLWDLGHNKIHHAYTNYREVDYVYRPKSPIEYAQSNFVQRMIYRLYRSAFGHGFYYGVEIWLKKMIVPFKHIEVHSKRELGKYWNDSIPLMLFAVTSILLTYFLSDFFGREFLLNIIFALGVPFFIWHWIMGFVIYQHHTNEHTRWYSDKNEWHYWEVQLEHSTHIRFPKPINLILHNIMEHTAHHSHMGIPLYNLSKAQEAIEAKFKDRIQVIEWSLSFYRNSIVRCKLYNYDNHKWVTFKEASFLTNEANTVQC